MSPVQVQETCPVCASPLRRTRQGSTLYLRCSSPDCTWNDATTFRVPIYQDENHYRLTIPPLRALPFTVLKALNYRLNHSPDVLRNLALRGQIPTFTGRAVDIWHEAQRLRKATVPFLIQPPYPFDLDQPADAFGPPDGPLDS